MSMKNLLQALNNIEPPKVEERKALIQEGVQPGQVLNVQMEDLDAESLRYLSGVRKTIEECGMAPMTSMVPKPPASINITAADATELGSMLKVMANLAGVHEYGKEEPVHSVDPQPAHRANGDSFADMIKLIDDNEIEEEIIQDGMNDDTPIYDNSPDRETHGGNWPLNGDMDYNTAANGDVIVDRNKMDIAEQLMSEYRAFVSEAESIDSVNQSEEETKLERQIASLKSILSNDDADPEMVKLWKRTLANRERELRLVRGKTSVSEDSNKKKNLNTELPEKVWVKHNNKLVGYFTRSGGDNIFTATNPDYNKYNGSMSLAQKPAGWSVVFNPELIENSDETVTKDPRLKTTTKNLPKPSNAWYVAILNNNEVEGFSVAMALHKTFRLSAETAWALMQAAHREGQAMVKGGFTKELAETKAQEAEDTLRQIHEERGLPYPTGVVIFIADTADLNESKKKFRNII